MIDLHSHILPGVDDGPGSWEESLAIVERAASHGVTAMVATPHMHPDGPWANDPDRVRSLVAELQQRVDQAGLAVKIYPGGEVYITPDLPRRVQEGQVLTYADARRYMLVELPATEVPPYLDRVIFELRLQGITPIIAHPERNSGVKRDPRQTLDWIERGALLQMNMSSLSGEPGEGTTRAAAEALLQLNAVHFLASDAHGVQRRPPLHSRDWEAAVSLLGEEGAHRLLKVNPEAVLKGESLPPAPPGPGLLSWPSEEPSARRPWMSRFRSLWTSRRASRR